MEELGEKIEKEIEGKFGPDFEKKMEELGEKIGKEMEAKLGPGSDFEKKMKELGKEMEAQVRTGLRLREEDEGAGQGDGSEVRPGLRLREEDQGTSREAWFRASEEGGQEGCCPGRRLRDQPRRGDGEGSCSRARIASESAGLRRWKSRSASSPTS